ncbi:MAG: A/G-specific adenine glycosylase [Desulfobacterales bacterium]|nr:A/G-specific adenine glycosylase [Desulfobacterales bacterium]
MDWYSQNHRNLPWRQTKDPYMIWVSEVMLQQTQVNTVIPYYLNFINHFPDVISLADADSQQVLKLWEGLGYYSRARNLHKAAKIILETYTGQIPKDPYLFIGLPGVGQYIMAAVQSIAFNHSLAVVDGNVKRVLARFCMEKYPVNSHNAHDYYSKIAYPYLHTQEPGTYNQAIMELGALICKPKKPNCNQCPIMDECKAFANGQVEHYPFREPKKTVPTHDLVCAIIFKNTKILIVQRKLTGFLGGLWEFPSYTTKTNKNKLHEIHESQEFYQENIQNKNEEYLKNQLYTNLNIKVSINQFLCRVKHAYTHFKILMDVYRCTYMSGKIMLNEFTDYRWIEIHELHQFPLPKSNHKCIPALKAYMDI